MGFTINGRIIDTMLIASLLDENRFSYSLNALSYDLLGEVKQEAHYRRAREFGLDPKAEMEDARHVCRALRTSRCGADTQALELSVRTTDPRATLADCQPRAQAPAVSGGHDMARRPWTKIV